MNREMLQQDADHIIVTYIKPGSVSEVNIPHTMGKQIIKSVETDEGYHYDMFDAAFDEIFKLMARDSFAR